MSEPMALSIRQPWAWLIVNGYKDVENRSWRTSRRGEVLVHTGKVWDKDGWLWVRSEFPEIEMPDLTDMDRGGIVGRANLVERLTGVFVAGFRMTAFPAASAGATWSAVVDRG